MPLSVRVALTPPNASLAQLEEHRTFNARARSSSLRRRTIYVACSSAGQNAGLWPRRSAVAGSCAAVSSPLTHLMGECLSLVKRGGL